MSSAAPSSSGELLTSPESVSTSLLEEARCSGVDPETKNKVVVVATHVEQTKHVENPLAKTDIEVIENLQQFAATGSVEKTRNECKESERRARDEEESVNISAELREKDNPENFFPSGSESPNSQNEKKKSDDDSYSSTGPESKTEKSELRHESRNRNDEMRYLNMIYPGGMASSTKETAQSRTNNAFTMSLPWMYGDRSYLQASKQDFQRIFLPRSVGGQNEAVVEYSSVELIEIAKLALKNGELEIAEKHCSKAIRKQKLENVPSEKIWEPYLYLGEVLERKAAKDDVELLQNQRLLLQAAALFNFTKNCAKRVIIESDFSVEMMKRISRKLLDIQDNLVLVVGGNPLRCNFDPENNKKDLEQLRNEVKVCLGSLNCDTSPEVQEVNQEDLRNKFVEETAEIRNLCRRVSSRVKQFLARIIKGCIDVLGDPPCDYEVIVLGSLARDEMTPYSDLEWAILISSEEDKCKVFFRNLTNLVHLQVSTVVEV